MARGCRSWPQVNVSPQKSISACVGEHINLEGWDCFDAAVQCAAICAGQRGSKALNLAKPDALPLPTHAVVATASPPSMEPYHLVEDSQEILGCWKQLRETFSELWCFTHQSVLTPCASETLMRHCCCPTWSIRIFLDGEQAT